MQCVLQYVVSCYGVILQNVWPDGLCGRVLGRSQIPGLNYCFSPSLLTMDVLKRVMASEAADGPAPIYIYTPLNSQTT